MSEQDTHASAATGMESELVSQVDAPYLTADQHEERVDQSTKESSHHSSRRKSSPSSHHRNYRKRSPSESPERRSPANSPSLHRRSRNSDYRDDRRHRRRSRTRSRSRSPRRRRRSPSPRNSTNERDSGRHYDEFGRDLRPEPQRGSSEEKDKAGIHQDVQQQGPLRKKSPSERKVADVERSPDKCGTVSPDRAEKERIASPRKSLERESQSPKRKDSEERRSKSPDKRRRSKSPDKRRRNKSPDIRRRSKSPDKRRRSKSPDVRRRSKSPDKRRRRSRSQSPERRRKKDYRRSPDRDSRDRRTSGDFNSNRRWDRSSNRDRNRDRDNRGRDWDRERRYNRGYDRDRNRDQDRNREQDRHDDQAISPTQDKKMFVKASSTGLTETLPRPARALTSEEVQAKLAAHAESLRKQAQDAASVLNLPSYINPSVVNPHQYAVQQQKRKLLWSGKKAEAAESNSGGTTAKSTQWNTTTFCNDQGGEMQAKFRRLMGIKGDGNTTAQQEGAQPQNDQLMADLEKEFERSRAFQLSRGAGGKSGIGLGYSGT